MISCKADGHFSGGRSAYLDCFKGLDFSSEEMVFSLTANFFSISIPFLGKRSIRCSIIRRLWHLAGVPFLTRMDVARLIRIIHIGRVVSVMLMECSIICFFNFLWECGLITFEIFSIVAECSSVHMGF